MLAQSKISNHSELKTLLDIILVAFGVLVGGLLALLGLWLWFDYWADPAGSLIMILGGNIATALSGADLANSYAGGEARLMGLPLTQETSAYWYMARSGGIVAYLLLWLSTVWGLTLSSKIITDLVPAPIAYGLHEFLSIGAVIFALLHAVVLLGDSYIQFTIFHLAIPFSAPYEPFWTGLGTVGLYLTAALTGSFYLRKQLGQKTWRRLHYLTFAAYGLALVHGLMAGTDSGLSGMKLLYLGTGFTVLFLTYYRLFTLKVKEKKPARRSRPRPDRSAPERPKSTAQDQELPPAPRPALRPSERRGRPWPVGISLASRRRSLPK
jgi:DMSO/TMAO reductase YedYZ heme-binding membrane subunit